MKDFDRRNLKIKNLILTSSLDSSKKFTKIKNFCDKKGIKIIGIGPERELIKIKNDNKFYSVDSNNLIDRKKLKSNKLLLKAGVNKELSICVTGAGGSIGSELSRQILLLEPKKLILVDFCEFNLFKISEELKELSSENIIIKLLNTENEYDLEKIFSDYSVDVVFHAAAYKHVPIVESNNISGIKNNIISTKSVCSAAIKSGVRKMILISSDKAVRPTNIMGATKLISEFIVNEYSKLSKTKTIFSTVRFGNVINSSGSVIPIFREQIKNGGPITITHEKMERYFMTISEAVQLVLQASAIMKGGETFILDMGESIKIIEIAKKMILNSGFKLKDQNSGDIEIKFTGIRPGEKLKEELTINGNLIDTIHPLIKLANEDVQTPENLIEEVNKMIKNIKNYKYDEAIQIFNNLYKIKD